MATATAESLDRALAAFEWQRLRVRLRNTRQAFAREHPLYVFKAIFLHASQGLPGVKPDDPRRPYVFHPAERLLPNRLKRNQIYDLELCFPGSAAESAETIARFTAGLVHHLADPANNFAVEEISAPESQSIPALVEAALAGEIPGLDPAADEVALDFLTPFRWNRPTLDREAKIRWRFRPEQLILHLARRAGNLLPGLHETGLRELLTTPQSPAPGSPLETLPYYWHFDQFGHRPKTPHRYGSNYRQLTVGMTGPLYLRGPWQRLLPLLLLGSAWHLGNKIAGFQGHFRLRTALPFFDRRLERSTVYRAALEHFEANSDAADELAQTLESREVLLDGIQKAVASGDYQSRPARLARIPKKEPGDFRAIGLLEPRDQLAHRAIQDVLSPVFERMFEDASVGYRKRRSPATARKMIAAAVRDGCTYALESDVEAFFDQIDHEKLLTRLDAKLPRGDRTMRRLLEGVIRQPFVTGNDLRPIARERGVMQGSPLSPLLANFFLDPFDEAMEARGHRLVRYGDDFLILCRSRAEAERALAEAESELGTLGLSTVEDKTAITPVDLGFTFLGMDLGAELHEQFVEETALKKPAYVGPEYGFVGVTGNTLTIRRGGELIGQAPIHRLSELILLGSQSLSTRLLQVCSDRRIPVSFCSASGYYLNTLRPDSRRHFDTMTRHGDRFERLGPDGRLAIARRIGHAKIANTLHWLSDLPLGEAEKQGRDRIARVLPQFDRAETVDEVRGLEGRATAEIFPLINGLIRIPGFESEGRIPRRKPDRWNCLLDFGYFLLFTRLNVLTRGRGLNPYLGFLHSHHDRYESLVCDLQEPFRARIDRMIVKLVNRRVIGPEDFEEQARDDGVRYRVEREASGRFIQGFEREMETTLSGDPGKLRHLLFGQVCAVERWAWQSGAGGGGGGQELRIYRSGGDG